MAPFSLIEGFQLQGRLSDERNGAEEIIIPQLSLVLVGKSFVDCLGEEAEGFEDNRVLEEDHLGPIRRVDMPRYQVFKDHQDLDEEIEEVAPSGEMAQVVAVVMRRHLPENGEHDGDEVAHKRIVSLDADYRLDDGPQSVVHHFSHVVVDRANILPEEDLHHVAHDRYAHLHLGEIRNSKNGSC